MGLNPCGRACFVVVVKVRWEAALVVDGEVDDWTEVGVRVHCWRSVGLLSRVEARARVVS